MITAKLLTELKEVSLGLNNSTDSLNKYLAEIDTGLKILGLGVETWVAIESIPGKSTVEATLPTELGYAKANGKWGLHIRTSEYVWAITEAPRRLRTVAVSYIPDLLDSLVLNARGLVEGVELASDNAATIAAALRERH